uniref:Uncharacterized protein n=1 Tax=Cacopsylla melanoneura TaxID=428564 RepID=A0A8D9BMT5_9HEMI
MSPGQSNMAWCLFILLVLTHGLGLLSAHGQDGNADWLQYERNSKELRLYREREKARSVPSVPIVSYQANSNYEDKWANSFTSTPERREESNKQTKQISGVSNEKIIGPLQQTENKDQVNTADNNPTSNLNNNTMQNLQRNRILNTSRKTDSAKTEKFSCSFDNEEYKKETNSPIWSEAKKTPDSLYLSELYDDRKFQITAAFTNVMANYTLNNVDQFIRFIQAYKNQRNDKLEPFFNNYHVAFQKNVPHTPEDPVSLLIEINRRLSENQESAKGKLYIVSAYVNPSDNLIEDVKKSIQNTGLDFEKKAETELSKDQYQRHVAGIIKIQTPNGEGIIVLDPGYMNGDVRVTPYSVVLMHNNRSKSHGDEGYAVKRGELEFNVQLRPKFALVSGAPSTVKTQSKHEMLYLRYKPFCSFMDSTTKGNLLGPNYGIWSFDHYGKPKGYLTFKVAPGNTTDKSPFFRVGPFDMYTGGYELKEFPFDSIKRDNTISQETIKKFDTIASYMSLKSGDTLLTKLQTIQSVVFENPKLVKEIDMLSTKLLNSKIKSTRQKLKNALSCFTGP